MKRQAVLLRGRRAVADAAERVGVFETHVHVIGVQPQGLFVVGPHRRHVGRARPHPGVGGGASTAARLGSAAMARSSRRIASSADPGAGSARAALAARKA